MSAKMWKKSFRSSKILILLKMLRAQHHGFPLKWLFQSPMTMCEFVLICVVRTKLLSGNDIRHQDSRKHWGHSMELLCFQNWICNGAITKLDCTQNRELCLHFQCTRDFECYKRLIFGLSSAPEMYQFVIQQTLQGIPGARNISDAIIVFGSDQESHDKNLDCTLSCLESKGLTLNREKCIFGVPEFI